MGESNTISREDFTAWYSPALTLGLLDRINFENVARLIHPALSSGFVKAVTETLTIEGAAVHLAELPASVWTTWTPQADLRFWATGNLIRPIQGKGTAISAFGVRFDPAGLALIFPDIASPVGTQPSYPPAKGGRPAGKNGEPIASMAKRLLGLPAGELASYTAEAVAAELVEEYRRLNLQPPSPDNAKRDAAGILRAVRN